GVMKAQNFLSLFFSKLLLLEPEVLCRAHLRKLLIRRSAKNLSKARLHQKEILGNFWGEAELFVPLFILVPHRIYSAIVNTILILIFVASFRGSEFAVSFVIIVSLILAFLSFFVYQIQKKINRQQNNFRQQENQAAEKYLENPSEPQKPSEGPIEKRPNLWTLV
ncbi:13092_t:CDS:2, partial [Racocetra persica]